MKTQRTAPVMTHAERRNERRALAELVRAGQPISEVMATTGASYEKIRRGCLENAVIPPREYHPKSTTVLQILSLLINSNHTCSEIARQLGVTRQRVSQVVVEAKTYGIPIRQAAAEVRA